MQNGPNPEVGLSWLNVFAHHGEKSGYNLLIKITVIKFVTVIKDIFQEIQVFKRTSKCVTQTHYLFRIELKKRQMEIHYYSLLKSFFFISDVVVSSVGFLFLNGKTLLELLHIMHVIVEDRQQWQTWFIFHNVLQSTTETRMTILIMLKKGQLNQRTWRIQSDLADLA